MLGEARSQFRILDILPICLFYSLSMVGTCVSVAVHQGYDKLVPDQFILEMVPEQHYDRYQEEEDDAPSEVERDVA